MDVFEVPLDAAAFRLYSLPAAAAVGSAWACLALLAAAALGLLGFRAVGYKLPENHPSPASPTPPPPPEPIPAKLPLQKAELTPVAVQAVRPASFHVEEASSSSSTPKARFTAYYYAAAAESDDDDDASYGEEDEVDRRVVAAPWDGVAECAADVRRRGDLGWYRYQDLTVLNGSVVKLWEKRDGHLTAGSFRRRQ